MRGAGLLRYVALTTVLAVAGRASLAQSVFADGRVMELGMSLQRPRIVLGEPIVLQYTVRNASGRELNVDATNAPAAWLTPRLLDARGRAVAQVPDHRPPRPIDDLRGPAVGYLAAGGSRTGWFVVSQVVTPTAAGQYTLRVKIRLSARAADGTLVGPPLAEDRTFSLTVLPPDRARLTRVAAELADAIGREKAVAKLWADIEALFSMPEDVVLPAWRKVACLTDGGDHLKVIDQLLRIASPGAAGVLALMYKSPLDTSVQQDALSALWGMYYIADADRRARLDPVFAHSGISTPKVPGQSSAP